MLSQVTNEIEVQSENEGPPPAPEKVPPSVSCPEEVNEGIVILFLNLFLANLRTKYSYCSVISIEE